MFANLTPATVIGYAGILMFLLLMIVSRILQRRALRIIDDDDTRLHASALYERLRSFQLAGFVLLGAAYVGLLATPLTEVVSSILYGVLVVTYGGVLARFALKSMRDFAPPEAYRVRGIIALAVIFAGYASIVTVLALGIHDRL